MKKLLKTALILSQALLLAACNSTFQNEETAYLSFSVKTSARLIEATNVTTSDIAKAELFYNLSTDTGNLTPLKTWTSTTKKNALELMIEETGLTLKPGTYDFTLNLYVANEAGENGYALTQTGLSTKNKLVVGNNALSFSTNYCEEGIGNVSLTFKWSSDARVTRAEVRLLEEANGQISAEIENSLQNYSTFETQTITAVAEGETAETLEFINYEKNGLSNGNYFYNVKLYQTINDVEYCIKNTSDLIKIRPGCTTGGESNGSIRIANINTRYEINYDANGGEYITGYEPVTSRNRLTAVNLPTEEQIKREGYAFKGWVNYIDGKAESNEDGNPIVYRGISYDDANKRDFNLTAQWVELVSYVANYYFEQIDNANHYELGSEPEVTNTIEKWYTGSETGDEIVEALINAEQLNRTFDHFVYTGTLNANVGSTITVNLKYDLETLNYTFNANGGRFSGNEETISGADTKYGFSLTETAPTRENYIFKHWTVSFTEKDSSTQITGTLTDLPATYGTITLTDGDGNSTTYDNVETATFTAEWEEENTSAGIQVSFDVKQDDINVTHETDESAKIITFTADTGYDSYSWKVDGTEQDEASNVLTIDASDWVTGVYDIYLTAEKDDETYSYNAQINWTKSE